MERQILVQEYLELRNYLNKSNKLPNQLTRIDFVIEKFSESGYRMCASVSNQWESRKIVLAERNEMRVWERSGYSPFKNIELFCSKSLNQFEKQALGVHRKYVLSEYEMIELTKFVSRIFYDLKFSQE